MHRACPPSIRHCTVSAIVTGNLAHTCTPIDAFEVFPPTMTPVTNANMICSDIGGSSGDISHDQRQCQQQEKLCLGCVLTRT